MSVSIQQENVFQQLSNPFAWKHGGLDKGGGAADQSLEDFYKGKIGIFHLRQVFFFFAFSSSSFFFFFSFKPCVKDISTKGEWKKKIRLVVKTPSFEGSPWRHLSPRMMLVFFCIRGDGCLPVTSLEKYCLALR